MVRCGTPHRAALGGALVALVLGGACGKDPAGVEAPAATESCQHDSDCPSEQRCSEKRRCVPLDDMVEVEGSGGQKDELDLDETGGSGGLPPGGAGAPGCVDIEVSFERPVPAVALVVDRSLSMNGTRGFDQSVQEEIAAGTYVPWGCPLGASDALDDPVQRNRTYRWNVVRNVLFHPDSGLVSRLEDQVLFGMTLYTSFDPREDEGVCPQLIEVDFAQGNRDTLLAAMECHDIGADTPTRETLSVVAQKLDQFDFNGPKAIILATDGAPDSCACPEYASTSYPDCNDTNVVSRGGQNMTPELAEQYDVVEEAGRIWNELGIKLSIVDMSSPEDVAFHDHLADVALAGGGALYDGLNPSGLENAFTSILGDIQSCEIELGGQIVAGNEERGTVTLDGAELALLPDDSTGDSGYVVRTTSSIELMGQACLAIKSGNHELGISFPCDTFQVIR